MTMNPWQPTHNSSTRWQIWPRFAYYCFFVAFIITTFYLFGSMNGLWYSAWDGWTAIYLLKTAIEVVASGYSLFYLFVALNYRLPTEVGATAVSISHTHTNTLLIYLCCNDLDGQALESLFANCAPSGIPIWVHDDSTTNDTVREVNDTVTRLSAKYQIETQIIRRDNREGGKPGAINNAIQKLPVTAEYIILCDSDSFFPHTNVMETALAYFDDPQVALVQFRNVGHIFTNDSAGYKILSVSVDFYDAFVSLMSRFGWTPFLGHNAVIRTTAMKAVGGFTAGQFADDIDFSVKLRLHGYRLVYAREIACGERHPLTYEPLRLRTQKWAYGCTQILVRWGEAILTSRQLTIPDKTTFFLTVAYYHFQLLLLVYLFIFYIVLPFKDADMGGTVRLLVSAGLILLLTFLPSITYFSRRNKLWSWLKAGAYWGVTYGSQDFVMLAAVLQYLSRNRLTWKPTNGRVQTKRWLHFLPELLFGSLIVVVAIWQHPALLILPTTILFAGKFLIAPLLNKLVFSHNLEA